MHILTILVIKHRYITVKIARLQEFTIQIFLHLVPVLSVSCSIVPPFLPPCSLQVFYPCQSAPRRFHSTYIFLSFVLSKLVDIVQTTMNSISNSKVKRYCYAQHPRRSQQITEKSQKERNKQPTVKSSTKVPKTIQFVKSSRNKKFSLISTTMVTTRSTPSKPSPASRRKPTTSKQNSSQKIIMKANRSALTMETQTKRHMFDKSIHLKVLKKEVERERERDVVN